MVAVHQFGHLIVDCGDRKIVEEVMLTKYSDYEMFSLKETVNQLKKNLDEAVFLRIHIINNIVYKDSVQKNVKYLDE